MLSRHLYFQSEAGLTRVERALLVPAWPLLTVSYSRSDKAFAERPGPQPTRASSVILSHRRHRPRPVLSPLPPWEGRGLPQQLEFSQELLPPKATGSASSRGPVQLLNVIDRKEISSLFLVSRKLKHFLSSILKLSYQKSSEGQPRQNVITWPQFPVKCPKQFGC